MEAHTKGKMIGNRQRRSQRFVLSVPVVAYRSQQLGLPFSEGTRTVAVSATNMQEPAVGLSPTAMEYVTALSEMIQVQHNWCSVASSL